MDTELIKKVMYADLEYPKGLKKFIFNNTNFKEKPTKKPKYVQSIETFNGKLLLRTFAFKNNELKDDKGRRKEYGREYKDIMIQEICRRMQGFKYVVLCNIHSTTMSGNVVEKWDKKWVYTNHENNIYLMPNRNYWFEGSYMLYDQQAIIDELGIKYCQWFKYIDECKKKMINSIPFFKYICEYINEPKIELLVKAGLSQFVSCYKKLNLKEKSLEKIFRINSAWIKQLEKLEYKDILTIRKYDLKNFEDLKEVETYFNYNTTGHKYVRKYFKISKSKKYKEKILKEEDMSEYMFFIYYNDYLDSAERLGIDLKNDIYLFPRDLKQKHDIYVNLKDVEALEHLSEGFTKSYLKNLNFTFSKGKYVILPCENTEQIVKEGKILHHCVAANYSERYANQQTNIYFIRRIKDIETPLATLELNNKRVIQCRTAFNNSPSEEVIAFVNCWCEKNKFRSCFSNEE